MGLRFILNAFGAPAAYWDLQVLPSCFEDHLRSAWVNSHLPVTKVLPHLLVLRLRSCVSAKLSPTQVNKGAAVGQEINAQPLPVSWVVSSIWKSIQRDSSIWNSRTACPEDRICSREAALGEEIMPSHATCELFGIPSCFCTPLISPSALLRSLHLRHFSCPLEYLIQL